MARPRILLVPTLTELEWRIKPLLEDWADVASYDAPGVGAEPPAHSSLPEAVIKRGLAEIDSRSWDECVVVGDEYGIYGAIHVATERPDAVSGLALGHACLSFQEDGEQRAVNRDSMHGRHAKTVQHQLPRVCPPLDSGDEGCLWQATAKEYLERVPHDVSRGYQSTLRETADAGLAATANRFSLGAAPVCQA